MATNEPKRRKNGRKKKRHSSYILLYIALGLLGVITLVVLSLTVFFPIKNVEIYGSSIYSAEDIKKSADIELDTNLFTSDLSKVEKNITTDLPYISSVKVSRKFPSTITLTVEKADVFAQVEQGGKYILIDKNAKCLETKDKITKDIPVVRGSKLKSQDLGEKAVFNDAEGTDSMRMISDIIISAKNNDLKLTVVNVSDKQNVWATYDNKTVLLFGSCSNLEIKFKYAVETLNARKNNSEQGTLNLSRLPNSKKQVSFLLGELTKEQIAEYK